MDKKLIIFIPSIEEGGVEKNLFIVSNYLIKKNVKVEILTCNNNKAKFFDKKIKFIGTSNNFWHSRSRTIKYLACIFLLFLNLLKSKSNKLIFAFQANIYAILISKIFNAKIIVRANSAPSGWSHNMFKKKIYSFLINLADDVMVNSIQFKKDFKKIFNIKTKYIYNPFDKTLIKKNNNKKNLFKKKSLKILSIGRLTSQKDHITLLKAAKLINPNLNPEILIIGKGSEYYNLKNYIKINNLKNIVKLIGYKKQPYSYIQKSDIFVLTSKYEGLPNVLLEAQYLKKYIISTSCPTGPREILLNGRAGDLFDVGNYKKLASFINKYKFNKKNISIKTRIGFKNFRRFDYFENCNKYYNFVSENF